MALGITEAVANLNNTADGTSYAFGAFTPAANCMLAVGVTLSASDADAATISDSSGLTWTKRNRAQYESPEAEDDEVYLWTAPVGGSPSSTTITVDCTGDAATGAFGTVFQITGTTVTFVQSKVGTGAHTTAPSVAFDSNMNTNNAYVSVGGGGSNPPAVTPPASWTETADLGHTPPDVGHFSGYRVNGETGATVAWTGGQVYGWGMAIAEFSEGTATVVPVFMNQYRQRTA
jgi:hypothetical protein